MLFNAFQERTKKNKDEKKLKLELYSFCRNFLLIKKLFIRLERERERKKIRENYEDESNE